ncbi:unnamed protein product [Phytophthora fragariaefolia]|uniref:Unnamed protein product n=1 Tax=Phytophthora fragariaefolia TaxID=1490495 RepID=A0A9W7D2Y5_9STRA|nr:unnamed protein product [Phytophthora fragariaefolia]
MRYCLLRIDVTARLEAKSLTVGGNGNSRNSATCTAAMTQQHTEWLGVIERQQQEIELLRRELAGSALSPPRGTESRRGSDASVASSVASLAFSVLSMRDGGSELPMDSERYAEICEKMERMRAALARKDAKLQKVRAQSSEEQKAAARLRDIVASLRSEMETQRAHHERELAASRDAVDKAVEKAARALMKNDTFNAELSKTEEVEAELREEIRVRSGALREADGARAEMQKELNRVRHESSRLVTEIRELQKERSALQSSLQAIQQELSAKRQCDAEWNEVNFQKQILQQRVNELETSVQQKNVQLEQQTKTIDHQNQQIQHLKEEQVLAERASAVERAEDQRHAQHLLKNNISLKFELESEQVRAHRLQEQARGLSEASQMLTEDILQIKLKVAGRDHMLQRSDQKYCELATAYRGLSRHAQAIELSERELVSVFIPTKKRLTLLQDTLTRFCHELEGISKQMVTSRKFYSDEHCVSTASEIESCKQTLLLLGNSSKKRKDQAISANWNLKRDLVIERCQRTEYVSCSAVFTPPNLLIELLLAILQFATTVQRAGKLLGFLPELSIRVADTSRRAGERQRRSGARCDSTCSVCPRAQKLATVTAARADQTGDYWQAAACPLELRKPLLPSSPASPHLAQLIPPLYELGCRVLYTAPATVRPFAQHRNTAERTATLSSCCGSCLLSTSFTASSSSALTLMYWALSAAIFVYVSWISSGAYGITTGWPWAPPACAWPPANPAASPLTSGSGSSGGASVSGERGGELGAAVGASAAKSLELGRSGGLRFMCLVSSSTWHVEVAFCATARSRPEEDQHSTAMALESSSAAAAKAHADPSTEASEREARVNVRRQRIEARNASKDDASHKKQLQVGDAQRMSRGQQQVADSLNQLDRRKLAGIRHVTSVRVEADDAENRRRVEEEERRHRRVEKLQQEAIESGAKNAAVEMRWADLFQFSMPQELHNELELQNRACAEILASKDAVIREFQNQLKAKDEEYVSALKIQAEEVEKLIDRMSQQYREMQDEYELELEQMEDAFLKERDELIANNKLEIDSLFERRREMEMVYMETKQTRDEQYLQEIEELRVRDAEDYNELKIKLETNIQTLEQQLEEMRATYQLNTEKLEYNYRVLTERDMENSATLSQQKRKLARLKDALATLIAKYNQTDARDRHQNEELTEEYRRLTKQYRDLQRKYAHFEASDSNKFDEVWQMHEEEAIRKIEKLLDADRIIHEQQLGLTWRPPVQSISNWSRSAKAGDVTALQKQLENGDESSPDATESEKGNRREDSGASAEDDFDDESVEAYTPPVKKISGAKLKYMLKMLASEAGFLVNGSVQQALENLPDDEAELVKADMIMRTLGIDNEEDMEKLMGYFFEDPRQEVTVSSGDNNRENKSPGKDSKDGSKASWGLVVGPEDVIRVIKRFVDRAAPAARILHRTVRGEGEGSKKSAKGTSSSALKAKARKVEKEYWVNIVKVFPAQKLRVMATLEKGLTHYNTALLRRKELIDDVTAMKAQNAELKSLLKQYLAAPINEDLIVPPTQMQLYQ